MIAWATMAFVSLTLVAFIFAVVFQCHPIEFAWNKAIDGKCVNQTPIFYSHAGINIVTDFVIYILPMKMLWGVVRPKKDKVGLVIVFAIGIFVCLAGIIRLWAHARYRGQRTISNMVHHRMLRRRHLCLCSVSQAPLQ